MTKSFRHYDADSCPNDFGPPDKLSEETRTPKEIGDSELETIAEHDEQYNLDSHA